MKRFMSADEGVLCIFAALAAIIGRINADNYLPLGVRESWMRATHAVVYQETNCRQHCDKFCRIESNVQGCGAILEEALRAASRR